MVGSNGRNEPISNEAVGDPSISWVEKLEQAGTCLHEKRYAEAAQIVAKTIEAIQPYSGNPYLHDTIEELKAAKTQLEGGSDFKVAESLNNAGHLIERAHSL